VIDTVIKGKLGSRYYSMHSMKSKHAKGSITRTLLHHRRLKEAGHTYD
jgi:hypothetical protein